MLAAASRCFAALVRMYVPVSNLILYIVDETFTPQASVPKQPSRVRLDPVVWLEQKCSGKNCQEKIKRKQEKINKAPKGNRKYQEFKFVLPPSHCVPTAKEIQEEINNVWFADQLGLGLVLLTHFKQLPVNLWLLLSFCDIVVNRKLRMPTFPFSEQTALNTLFH